MIQKHSLEFLGKKAAELGENLILPGQWINGSRPRVGKVIKLYEKVNPSKEYRVRLVKEVTRKEFEDQRKRMGLSVDTKGEFFHEVVSD